MIKRTLLSIVFIAFIVMGTYLHRQFKEEDCLVIESLEEGDCKITERGMICKITTRNRCVRNIIVKITPGEKNG